MKDADLSAVRVARLRQYLEAMLPKADPNLFGSMFRLLAPWAAKGVDVIHLVDPVLRRPATYRVIPDPAVVESGGLGFEDLPGCHRATLWPYRPRIRPDELLSSWLWRVARGIGAPPKRFARDAIGAQLADVDREIDNATIERIAFMSGHTPRQLLRGTLRADVASDPLDKREHTQRLLLRHGDLVLNGRRGGRMTPITQYCPVCLSDPDPYLPRGWRFSFEVACFKDGCFLLDKCWRCAALLNPLAQTSPSDGFMCVRCGTPFASAPSLRIDWMVEDQSLIYERLNSLAFSGSSFIGSLAFSYINLLSSGDLRGTNPKNEAERHKAVLLEAWSQRPSLEQPARPERALVETPQRPRRAKASIKRPRRAP